MGVPGLFGWVGRKYKTTVRERTQNGKIEFADETCDHLYVDLNHILHSCAHSLGLTPDDGPLEGIFHHIARYLDWLMDVAQPQSLVLIAVDGVAPKAKLIQQRTRRFLGAHRRQLARELGSRPNRNWTHTMGCSRTRTAPQIGENRREDIPRSRLVRPEYHHASNNAAQSVRQRPVGAQGTPFMAELMTLLHEYVDARLKGNSRWKHLKVDTRREGEHKIMKFIRDQRERQGYNRQTRHVVFGQDADLILLTLLTHEPRFRILREKMPEFGQPPTGRLPDFVELDIGKLRQYLKYGLDPFRSTNEGPEKEDETATEGGITASGDPAVEGSTHTASVAPESDFGFERTLEDFVFLTFLLGNDFLPSVPSLDIYDRHGGLDRLVDSYKKIRAKGRGFLTQGGSVDRQVFREVLTLTAADECDAYRRIQNHRRRLKERRIEDDHPAEMHSEPTSDLNAFEQEGFISVGALPEGVSVEEALRNKFRELEDKEDTMGPDLASLDSAELTAEFKRRLDKRIDLKLMADSDADPMRMGLPGYEQRYYTEISTVKDKDALSRRAVEMSKGYFQGLCWSFVYYTIGLSPVATTEDTAFLQKLPSAAGGRMSSKDKGPSNKTLYATWNWCYGYFYAPLLKDLVKHCREATTHGVLRPGLIQRCAEEFSLNDGPVPPFIQLLSVLPPDSAEKCLPEHLARLLTATRPDSEDALRHQSCVKRILRMFPEDLGREIDSRGKVWPHTIVVRLPFVEYELIAQSAQEVSVNEELSEEQAERNIFNCADLYLHKDLCQKLVEDAQKAMEEGFTDTTVATPTALSQSERREWGDLDAEDAVRDPVLDLLTPSFEALRLDEVEEDEEETVCLGCDIAGIVSNATVCAVLPGTLLEEPPLEGHTFTIQPKPQPIQPPQRKQELPKRGKVRR